MASVTVVEVRICESPLCCEISIEYSRILRKSPDAPARHTRSRKADAFQYFRRLLPLPAVRSSPRLVIGQRSSRGGGILPHAPVQRLTILDRNQGVQAAARPFR